MDEDILKTLENIEKILKGSGIFGGRSLANSASKAKEALKARFQKSDEKTFKGVAAAMKDLDSTVTSLDKSFKGLDSEIGRTTSGFSALNGQMAKFMTSMQPIQMGTVLTGTQNPNIRGQGPANLAPQQSIQPLLQQSAQNLLNLGGSSALLGVSFGKLGEAVKQMTTDFFVLSRVGLGSTASLMTLYKSAIMSGISLERYTTLLGENTALASRAGSLQRFDELTSAANKQLAVLGVFGDEAKSLQVSVGNSLTMMGISQSSLTSEISKQIGVFELLRKTTNMTAHEFSGLVKSVSESESTQRELVGLGPEQRNARIQELIQINTTGQRLGLAADASKKLADAMIAQRNETVKGRFEAAGRVRQLGAFLGMGAEGDRVAQLQMKGKNISATETEELMQLQKSLNTAAETVYQAGGIGVQNVIDQMREGLSSTGVGKVMDSTAAVELAQSSAGVFNKDFGQHVGTFGQIVGKLLTVTKGALDSPIAGALAGVGAAILFAFRGPIIGGLTKILQTGSLSAVAAMKPLSAVSQMFAGAAGTITSAAGKTGAIVASLPKIFSGALGSIGAIASRAGPLLASLPKMFSGALGAIATAGAKVSPFLSSLPKMFSSALGSIASVGSKAGPLLSSFAGVFQGFGGALMKMMPAFSKVVVWGSALTELFTGSVSNALNPEGGIIARIGGMISAFFSAIPNLIIDTLGFVFGESFGTRLQNGFDTFVAFMNFAIKDFLASLLSGPLSILEAILPKNSGLVKMFESARNGLIDSATKNVETVEKLNSDRSLTLDKISTANEKKSADTVVQATVAANKVQAANDKFNNVQYGTAVSQAQAIQDARAFTASPQIQVPTPVAPPAAVNNNTDAIAQPTQKGAQSADMVTVLQAILQMMTRSTAAEELQVEMAKLMLEQNRPRAGFASAEDIGARLMRNKQGMA